MSQLTDSLVYASCATIYLLGVLSYFVGLGATSLPETIQSVTVFGEWMFAVFGVGLILTTLVFLHEFERNPDFF